MWISTQVAIGTRGGTKVYVVNENVSIVNGDARFLMVRVCTAVVNLCCVVAHQPDHIHGEAIGKWCVETTKRINKHRKPDDRMALSLTAIAKH